MGLREDLDANLYPLDEDLPDEVSFEEDEVGDDTDETIVDTDDDD